MYSSGLRLPGLSIGIFVCMVLKRSIAVVASHAPERDCHELRRAVARRTGSREHDEPPGGPPFCVHTFHTERADCDARS